MSEYEEFLSNEIFAANFTAAYKGRHEPAEALWWLAHPGLESPNGTVSPTSERNRLRSRAYSREGNIRDQAALRSIEVELAADHKNTLDALGSVGASAPEPVRSAAVESAIPPEVSEWPVEDRSGVTTKPNRSRRWVGLTAALALVVGIGVGTSLPTATGLGSKPPPPTPSESISDAQPKMLDVFSHLQVASDSPSGITFGANLNPATFRKIGSFPATAKYLGISVFGVRNMARELCLVLIVDGSLESTITCVTDGELGQSGISLYRQGETQYNSVRWGTDGSLNMGRGSVAALTTGG